MWRLRRFVLRLFNFVRPGRAERELAREIASHLTALEEEFQLTPCASGKSSLSQSRGRFRRTEVRSS